MEFHASGTFDVQLVPLTLADPGADSTLARMMIDKIFVGDLQGTSRGEMLTAGSPDKGSAGYVAIERVSGSLQGRNGAFVLMHSGTMHRGQSELVIKVVPDSGTDALAGIAGTLDIKVTDGKHFYTLDYTLSVEE
jgi:Protein of unknown function (DUF3224)